MDAFGNPTRVILSAGQIADIERDAALIQDQPAEFIVADNGSDSDALVAAITRQGSHAVIPPRSNRLIPRPFDRHIYKSRNLIERLFSRIKQFGRIATRHDKTAKSFMSFVHLACVIVWLDGLRTRPNACCYSRHQIGEEDNASLFACRDHGPLVGLFFSARRKHAAQT